MRSKRVIPSPAQAPSVVVMVRPHLFRPNPQTLDDNDFQADRGADDESRRAFDEVTEAADTLRAEGVVVHLFEDRGTATPDSVFPNNWVTTHPDGRVVLYPMYAVNRRSERRDDVIDLLRSRYLVSEVVDYSSAAQDGLFLEGSGAMVFDHVARIAYVARSRRADPALVQRFAADTGFTPVVFDTEGPSGRPIYHTNVMMSVGSRMALLGSDLIPDGEQLRRVTGLLRETGHEIVELGRSQINSFCGNALELTTPSGAVLALSQRAFRALDQRQIATIERYCRIVALDVPTIEHAGGSVRCMLAGIHLVPMMHPSEAGGALGSVALAASAPSTPEAGASVRHRGE